MYLSNESSSQVKSKHFIVHLKILNFIQLLKKRLDFRPCFNVFKIKHLFIYSIHGLEFCIKCNYYKHRGAEYIKIYAPYIVQYKN